MEQFPPLVEHAHLAQFLGVKLVRLGRTPALRIENMLVLSVVKSVVKLRAR